VIDDLTGGGNHRAEVRFQFAPMDVRFDARGWGRATADGQRGLMLRSFAIKPVRADVRVGCRAPLEGWIAPNYGQLEPAPAVVFSVTEVVPIRVVTVLWPSENIGGGPPQINVIHDAEGEIGGLEFPDRSEALLFGDRVPVVEQAVAVAESF